jgi:uncharacterized protein (TIGR02265 family)
MTKLIGPERTLKRLTIQFKSGMNCFEVKEKKIAAGHYEVWFKDTGGLPHFYAGMTEIGISLAGGKDACQVFVLITVDSRLALVPGQRNSCVGHEG